jgi:hypothetical protein
VSCADWAFLHRSHELRLPDELGVSDLSKLRGDLVAEHARTGSPLGGHLRPGLAAEVVAARLAEAGLEPAPEAVALYGWADGIDQDSWRRASPGGRDLELFPYAFFPDLDAALRARTRMRALTEDTLGAGAAATDDELWRSSWLPIFDSDPGWYGLDCGSRDDPSPVWVMYWDSTEVDRTRQVFPSLNAMIEELVARFRAGAYGWSPEHRRLLADEGALAREFGQTQHAVEGRPD